MTIDTETECFFIAPIGSDGSSVRKRSDGVRDFVVKEAAAACGLETRRADEFGEPGQITSQIVEHCLKAKMCVADLTGGNENVYYELSVRHGQQLPVVLIADADTTLPFDVGQARVIFFDHADLSSALKAREEVKEQIRAALESGVPADNPIANGLRIAQIQSGGGDAIQRLVLERLERLSAVTTDLEARFRKSERREQTMKIIRNQRVHGTGDPDFDLTLQNFIDFYDHHAREQEAKEAEEAGLSPGAYLDDEIVAQEEAEPTDPGISDTDAGGSR